jgi:hypothetical protein
LKSMEEVTTDFQRHFVAKTVHGQFFEISSHPGPCLFSKL